MIHSLIREAMLRLSQGEVEASAKLLVQLKELQDGDGELDKSVEVSIGILEVMIHYENARISVARDLSSMQIEDASLRRIRNRIYKKVNRSPLN